MNRYNAIEVVLALCCNAPAVNVVPKIRENFATYSEFLDDQKTIETRAIVLREIAFRRVKKGNSGLSCSVVNGEKRFEAEISMENHRRYKLKVFAEWFGGAPCLRFDSEGRAHCNPEDGRGLAARQVLTPHFHRFNSEGVEIAYKSSVLAQETQAATIVDDLELGVAHFCQEARLRCLESGYPELVLDQGELDVSSEDPLGGVAFA